MPCWTPCAEPRRERGWPASVPTARVQRRQRRAGKRRPRPFHFQVPEQAAYLHVKQHDGLRIGIELFGTQTLSRHRGIGRYSRNLVTTLLARDPANDYVLYGRDGLPTDQIPKAPNAIVRLLRPDPAAGETTLTHAMERLTETNPDGLDVLLLAQPPGNGPRLRPPRPNP